MAGSLLYRQGWRLTSAADGAQNVWWLAPRRDFHRNGEDSAILYTILIDIEEAFAVSKGKRSKVVLEF